MTTSSNASLARELWSARSTGSVVSTDNHPASLDEAYALLAEVTQATEKTVVGYKLGATTEPALGMMQLEEPFAGPLLDGSCFDSGHQATVHSVNNPGIETEFVLGLSQDIPTDSEVTEDTVRQAIGWIAGGFEIIGARFAEMPTGRGLCTIGDGAGNHMVITGAPHKDWSQLDIAALPATLTINGEAKASGFSRDSLFGSPIAMLTWFANSNTVPARGIKAGDIIYCGTCTGLTAIQSGDDIEADFGVLGTVTTTIA